jgi:hypothetical protein
MSRLFNRAPRGGGFNRGIIRNSGRFHRDDPFFALQMVNFSSLHDKGRPDDALHQLHSIELVSALRMGVPGRFVQPEVAYFHNQPPQLTLLKVMAQGEPDEKLWRERNVCCF